MGERQHRPPFGPGQTCEFPIGVDRHRIAHGSQHRFVGGRVRVGPAGRQVDVVRRRQLADGIGLVGAVGVEVDLTGVAAGVVDPGPAGDGAVHPEMVGEGEHDLLG